MNQHTPLRMSASTLRPSLAGLVIAVLVAGCGGGGTDGSTDAAPQDVALLPEAVAVEHEPDDGATDAEAQALQDVSTAAVSTGSTCGLANFQASALARINQYRAAGASCRTAGSFAPAKPLVWNIKLLQAAAGHSTDMATRNYFSHTSFDGRTFVKRINATGYLWTGLAENIAAGQTSVNAVVDGWMKSDGHCANIMKPTFVHVGLACASSTTSTYKMYWTMDLGKPR